MRFSLLGSGSSGNVAYVEAGPADAPTRVLVDAGLCRAAIDARLERLPGPPITVADMAAVLVTHEHNDHAAHARTLGRPIWATAGSRRALGVEAELVRGGVAFRVGAITVSPVVLPHDASETVGYVLDDGVHRLGILTDCGHDAPEVADGFAGCHALVLETNYDPQLLRLGPYPPSLKRRVGGERGHLSNEQAAALLGAVLRRGPAPSLVVAAHLSQANNRPALARRALERTLDGIDGVTVVIATQAEGTPIYTLDGASVGARGGERRLVREEPMRNQQLAFTFTVPDRNTSPS